MESTQPCEIVVKYYLGKTKERCRCFYLRSLKRVASVRSEGSSVGTEHDTEKRQGEEHRSLHDGQGLLWKAIRYISPHQVTARDRARVPHAHLRVLALAWQRPALTSPKGLPCAYARNLADLYDDLRRAAYFRTQSDPTYIIVVYPTATVQPGTWSVRRLQHVTNRFV